MLRWLLAVMEVEIQWVPVYEQWSVSEYYFEAYLVMEEHLLWIQRIDMLTISVRQTLKGSKYSAIKSLLR